MPKPLLSKLIVQGAIGFFCVLFGCVYGLHTKDHIFFIMSLLIGVGSIIRVLLLRTAKSKRIQNLSEPASKEKSVPSLSINRFYFRLLIKQNTALHWISTPNF